MRYWNRLRDPDIPRTRSRSVTQVPTGIARSQFGQRPMFSVPGPDQPPPEEGRLNPEARLDDVVPTDESVGSEARTELHRDEVSVAGVMVPYVAFNVSYPPTDAQLTSALGTQAMGYMALVIDGVNYTSPVWLCVKSFGDSWWYELLSRAT